MNAEFSLSQLLVGLLLGTVIGALARRAGALSASGAWAAAIVGGLIFGLGGLPWATILLAFFISSSALSRAFAERKADLGEKFAKGSKRDAGQVLANGGVGAALVIVHAAYPQMLWPWVAYAGAMATVNGDTWATEIGVLSNAAPRLITNGQRVERGASGGVTWLGWFATLLGAGLIAGVAAIWPSLIVSPILFMSATAGGLAGASFDSLLGASVQAIYFCPECKKETERHPLHSCGTGTTRIRGWSWLDNDMVNLLSSGVGALAAALVGMLARM